MTTELHLYEIINPSDSYTFRAPDFQVAAAAVMLVGNGQLCLRRSDGTKEDLVPIFVLMNEAQIEKWLADHYGDFGEWLKAHAGDLAQALESVMSFGPHERGAYDDAIALMDAETAKTYREKVHNRNRSSMNDIGEAAWQLAARLREAAAGTAES